MSKKKKTRRHVQQSVQPKAKRDYKDRLIRMIFKDKKELLNLYNAMNHTHYTNPNDLEITTLENAIYMNMKNDISFVIHTELWLYEHQSTFNPNMPLRDLFYVAELYKGMTADDNLYGSTIVKIPAPQFIILYNGVEKKPEHMELRLSDMYEEKGTPSLELCCTMLNINPGFNEQLKNDCKSLQDYVIYVELVRKYRKQMKLEDAVKRAVDECIENNVLADFLRRNMAEAMNVSIFEYDEKKHMQQERDEWMGKGEERINQLTKLLADAGRMDDIVRAATDKEFQKSLLQEFGLE